MWNWLWKLLRIKSKQLPTGVVVHTLPVNTDELPDAAWVALNPPTLPSFDNMKPNLHQSLAKARQEALDPVLPEALKDAVEAGVNVVLPELFKKHLMSKTDLILMGKTEIGDAIDKRINDNEWNSIKCFIIKRLNDDGIKAENSTTGGFVMCTCDQILKVIKDTQVLIEVEDKEPLVINSVGIYR